MPRRCVTKYAVYGDKSKVRAIHRFCQRAFDEVPVKLAPHDPDRWLGQLVALAGENPGDCRCMGWVTDLRYDMKRGIMFLTSNDVEVPQFEALQCAIASATDNARDVHLVYLAMEPESGIFVNTDTKGRVFPERYYVELRGVEVGGEYHTFSKTLTSAREVISLLGDVFHRTYHSIAECQRLAEVVCERSGGFMRVIKFDDY